MRIGIRGVLARGMLLGLVAFLAAACGTETNEVGTERPASNTTSDAVDREDPYERIRTVDSSFTIRSTLKVNPCDGRFMDLMEEQAGLVWDESPTAMDGIAGGKSFTKCRFKNDAVSLLVVSQDLSFDVVEPDLEPRDDWDLPGAHWWDIGERRSVVRPTDYGGGTCDVGLETSFGYMSFSGRHRYAAAGDSCAAVKAVVEKLEPHLWD